VDDLESKGEANRLKPTTLSLLRQIGIGLHFREAIDADPNLAEAYFNLAVTLTKQNKHEQAKESFQKALDLAPTSPRIRAIEILKKTPFDVDLCWQHRRQCDTDHKLDS
jgi:tetratricopeptide (TPR) repeat protein